MRATALLIVALLAIVALAASEHSASNAGLPLIHAAATQAPARLFVPCPLSPQNLPPVGQRNA